MNSEEIQQIKQRFGIIGFDAGLVRAIETAVQVAGTELSVLITGENGVGKEVFPQIIHQYSSRRRGPYIAVNCGSIPEGLINSELFGHEKGAFTGAVESRKGYFETADHGTIFLDEVGELPLPTQVLLLRVLETGQFMRVGSSEVRRTDVRVVAATNLNVPEAVARGKFRQDLYYRLNAIPIAVPPLRERGADVCVLFRQFASDYAAQYRMPSVQLTEDARLFLMEYMWPGNIRQLRNVTGRISILAKDRTITREMLEEYLPDYAARGQRLPALRQQPQSDNLFSSEREEFLYRQLFDLRRELDELKRTVAEMHRSADLHAVGRADLQREQLPSELQPADAEFDVVNTFDSESVRPAVPQVLPSEQHIQKQRGHIEDTEAIQDESLSLEDAVQENIRKALEKHKGNRKAAAAELGISERTLYRKIKQYQLD